MPDQPGFVMRRLGIVFVQVAAYVGVTLLAWHALTAWAGIPPLILPSVGSVLGSLRRLPSFYLHHFLVTTSEALLGLLAGGGTGFAAAILLHYSRPAARIFLPLIVVLQVFPKEALAPLFVVMLGLGLAPKVLIAALICFFPVIVNTHRGLGSVPAGQIELMRSLGANELDTFLYCRMPYASRYVMAALRMCVTLAIVGAVVGEFSGSGAGLGNVIRATSNDLGTERLYASLILLGILGLSLYGVVVAIDYWLRKYTQVEWR